MRTSILVCHANDFAKSEWRLVDEIEIRYPMAHYGYVLPEMEEYLSFPAFDTHNGMIVRFANDYHFYTTVVYNEGEFTDVGMGSDIIDKKYPWTLNGTRIRLDDGFSWPDAWVTCTDPHQMMENLAKFAPVQRIVLICVELIKASMVDDSDPHVHDRILNEAVKWAKGKRYRYRYSLSQPVPIRHLFEIIKSPYVLKDFLRPLLMQSVGIGDKAWQEYIMDIIRKSYSLHDVLIDLVSK